MRVFPPLETHSLFLASPSDVDRLRLMACDVFDEMANHAGRNFEISVFDWENAKLEDNDARPIQSRISRPDDPKSLGLVAFFGERVGQPLPDDFPKEMLEDLPGLLTGGSFQGKSYRLVHPWKDEAELDGGFPLTGSTFEVLCALAGQRQLDKVSANSTLPSFICFASPPNVLEEEDVSEAPWGNDKLLDEINATHKGRSGNPLRYSAHLQRDQLRNFACYLMTLVGDLRFIADDNDILEAYKGFLKSNSIASPDLSETDPFRGLKSYDVSDTRAYFGRTQEIRQAVRLANAAFDDDGVPNFLWIKGSSGVGKSSFLRAGVIGELVTSPTRNADFAYQVFRPNELLVDEAPDAATNEALYVFFKGALSALRVGFTDMAPDDSEVEHLLSTFSRIPDDQRGEWVAETLDKCVKGTQHDGAARPNRMVLGIDQFEEIVDMVHDPHLQDRWASFVDYLIAAPKSSAVFVAATLRQRRLEIMQDHKHLSKIWTATSDSILELEFPNATALETIIRQPFELIGKTSLSEDVVRALLDEVRRYRETLDGRSAGSMMPLVSLVLERLHREVGGPLRKRKFGGQNAEDASDDFEKAASEELDTGPVEITLDAAQPILNLESVISELAARAMEEAELGEAAGETDSKIDDLLRKLVRWTGLEAQGDTQFFLPAIEMPAKGDEAKLARALLNNRILMNVGEGKVKLVHETVTINWPAAKAFLERERPLYRSAHKIGLYAEEWNDLGRGEITPSKIEEFAESAADILGLWVERLADYFNSALEPMEQRLRDYCLELIKQLCEPCRVVERTPMKSHHLYIAALYDRLDIVESMLEKDPTAANFPRGDNRTAVFPLCWTCNVDMLDKLIEMGADVDVTEDEGFKPIQIAAIGGSITLIERLLANGATLDTPNLHALHWAARFNHPKLVRHLILEHGVDPAIEDKNNWTPSLYAAQTDAADALRALDELADLNAPIRWSEGQPKSFAPIHVAAANGCLEATKALLEIGVPLDSADGAGANALHYAAKNGHPQTTAYLAGAMADFDSVNVDSTMLFAWSPTEIEKAEAELAKAKPNKDIVKLQGWTALHVAAKFGHIQCVQALIRAGADPNLATKSGQTALELALGEEHDEIVIWLAGVCDLKQRDSEGRTPLQAALHRDDMALALELASRDPDRKHDYLQENTIDAALMTTGLHRSAADSHERITKFYLLGRGVDLEQDVFGRTPLHIAALNGRVRQIKPLVRGQMSNLLVKDRDGHVPLEAAALAGRSKVFEALLDLAPDLDPKSYAPNALHLGARGGVVSVVDRLLDLGYSPLATDDHGRTPVVIATLHDNVDIVARLFEDPEVRAQALAKQKPYDNALTLAIEVGALKCLEVMLKAIQPDPLPLEGMVWGAVECMQFEAAALLIEFGGTKDFVKPESNLSLSDLYRAVCDRHRKALPADKIRSSRLEALLFPEPPIFEGGSSIPNGPGPTPSPSSGSGPSKVTTPAIGSRMRTQSSSIGYGADISPAFDYGRALWERLSASETEAWCDRVNPIDGKHAINPATAKLYRRQLPWYDNVELFQISDPETKTKPNLAFYFLTFNDELFRLNGTSPPIHELNAKAPISLSNDNVADYLRFFCFFVRGEEGPFYLVESIEDPFLPPAETTVKSLLEGTARHIVYEGMNAKGHYLLNGVVFYSNALFTAQMAVYPSGMVEMLDDEPIAADLPVRLDWPLA